MTLGDSTTPISATAAISTLLGQIQCTYDATRISGSASNSGSTIAFANQTLNKTSGSNLCPASESFSATYGPIVDSTQSGSPAVFVN